MGVLLPSVRGQMAENPAYAPIEFTEGQELTIWGVVTSVIQRIKR